MEEHNPSQIVGLSVLEEAVVHFIRSDTGSFGHLALAIHAHQRANCPPYDAFCAQFPKPGRWQDIPCLPLSAFRHAAIRAFPEDGTVRTFRTSGTTGEGFGEHHLRTTEIYKAAALAGWRRAGLPESEVFCLMPSPEENPYSSLSCMAGWLAPRERFFSAPWERLETALATARKPVLFGTALAFLDLFEWLGERPLRLSEGAIAVETGGYKGTRRSLPKAGLYALFQSRLGLPEQAVWNEYGMTELSSQFYARGLNRPHSGPPWTRALVIDPETGDEAADGAMGILHLWDLANVGSCCALQTRDLAVRRGSDFELIGRDPAALPRGCSRAADELLRPETSA